ncbi:VWA domain-containing protein, partial [Conexibacter stalactiti]
APPAGSDTAGADATTAPAAAAKRAGVQVDAVPLASRAATPAAATPAASADAATRAAPDAAVTRLTVPSPLRAGDQLALQATIRSTTTATATVVLARDGAEVGRERVALTRGDNPLLLTYRAPAAGWHAYRLAVELPGDAVTVNDALDATTRVSPPPRALVVAETPDAVGTLPAVLQGDGIEVATTTPQALATAELEAADTIVLADVPARALDAAQTTALTAAVRDGGAGLLVLGGPHSLSLGGWAGSPLDALLPVQSLRPGGVRKRQLALGLVLDRSSSMNDLAGGVDPKIAMARAAAQSALELTARDEDELAVVAFDAVARDLLPLQRTTTGNAGAIGELIDGLDADGGTNILRGLERGAAQLARSAAPVRHLILLSDGVSEEGDYEPLLARLRQERITLSTVALGQDADTALMRRLARSAGGRFYAVPDARELPRVFARETRRSAPSVGVRATLPVTATAASPLTADLSGRSLPPLRGTVLTRLRPGAVAPLSSEVNGRATPILAQGQQGLGRVVVWTPGGGPWAGDWLNTRPQLFTAAARWAQRGVATPPLQPSLAPGDPGTVVVDPLATAGTTLDLATVTGTVRAPDDTVTQLTFNQVAPSRYAAPLPRGDGTTGASARPAEDGASPPTPGVYGVAVSAAGGEPADDPAGAAPSEQATSADALLAVPYPAEFRPQPADAGRLGTLTAATGGRLLDPGDPAAALAPDPGDPLWRIPVAAALILLLAAVAASRLARRP